MTIISDIGELRYKVGTSRSTSFTAPDNSAWDSGDPTSTAAGYLRAFNVNVGGLAHDSVEDQTLKRNLHEFYPPPRS